MMKENFYVSQYEFCWQDNTLRNNSYNLQYIILKTAKV